MFCWPQLRPLLHQSSCEHLDGLAPASRSPQPHSLLAKDLLRRRCFFQSFACGFACPCEAIGISGHWIDFVSARRQRRLFLPACVSAQPYS